MSHTVKAVDEHARSLVRSNRSAVQANVARAADVDRLYDATLERFRSLDIVVVNVARSDHAH